MNNRKDFLVFGNKRMEIDFSMLKDLNYFLEPDSINFYDGPEIKDFSFKFSNESDLYYGFKYSYEISVYLSFFPDSLPKYRVFKKLLNYDDNNHISKRHLAPMDNEEDEAVADFIINLTDELVPTLKIPVRYLYDYRHNAILNYY